MVKTGRAHLPVLDPSPALLHFQTQLGGIRAFQLIRRPFHDRSYAKMNVRVMDYERFLAGLV